jgi:hypothetical protein
MWITYVHVAHSVEPDDVRLRVVLGFVLGVRKQLVANVLEDE